MRTRGAHAHTLSNHTTSSRIAASHTTAAAAAAAPRHRERTVLRLALCHSLLSQSLPYRDLVSYNRDISKETHDLIRQELLLIHYCRCYSVCCFACRREYRHQPVLIDRNWQAHMVRRSGLSDLRSAISRARCAGQRLWKVNRMWARSNCRP